MQRPKTSPISPASIAGHRPVSSAGTGITAIAPPGRRAYSCHFVADAAELHPLQSRLPLGQRSAVLGSLNFLVSNPIQDFYRIRMRLKHGDHPWSEFPEIPDCGRVRGYTEIISGQKYGSGKRSIFKVSMPSHVRKRCLKLEVDEQTQRYRNCAFWRCGPPQKRSVACSCEQPFCCSVWSSGLILRYGGGVHDEWTG